MFTRRLVEETGKWRHMRCMIDIWRYMRYMIGFIYIEYGEPDVQEGDLKTSLVTIIKVLLPRTIVAKPQSLLSRYH